MMSGGEAYHLHYQFLITVTYPNLRAVRIHDREFASVQ